MHQQEVRGIGLLTFLLGHTRRHRDSGHAGRADQRVDLAAGELVHQLRQQHAARRAHAERDDAHRDDFKRAHRQEGRGSRRCADRDAEENRDDIHQLVLHRLVQTFGHAAFLREVAQHQAADQRSSGRQQQRNQNGDDDGEDNLLRLGGRLELLHDDFAFLLGGQGAHNRRLNDRHQRHVGVRRDRDRAKEVRGELARQPNRRRAVRAADDADGARFRSGEAEHGIREDERHEDAQLRRRAQQQRLGVGDQRPEVRARANAHEDKARIDAQLHAEVQVVQKTRGNRLARRRQHRAGGGVDRAVLQEGVFQNDGSRVAVGGELRQNVSKRHQLRRVVDGDGVDEVTQHDIVAGQNLTGGIDHVAHGINKILAVYQDRAAEQRPVGMTAGEEFFVEDVAAQQVGQQHTEGNRQQQQRLKLLDNGEIQQYASDGDHDQRQRVRQILVDTRGRDEPHEGFAHIDSHYISSLSFGIGKYVGLRQHDQRVARADRRALGHNDLRHFAVLGGGNFVFHLHGFQHAQHRARLDRVANLDLHVQDVAGHGRLNGFAARHGSSRSSLGRSSRSRRHGSSRHRGSSAHGRSGLHAADFFHIHHISLTVDRNIEGTHDGISSCQNRSICCHVQADTISK